MIYNLKQYLVERPRSEKRFYLIILDCLLISIITLTGFYATKTLGVLFQNPGWIVLPLAILVTIPIYIKMGLYRAVLKYFRSKAVGIILFATFLSTLVWVGLVTLLNFTNIPISVVLLYWLGTFMAITVTRLSAQQWLYGETSKNSSAKKVLIYGAGTAGSQLAMVLKPDQSYSLIGYVDDDKNLQGWDVLGLKVYPPEKLSQIIERFSVDEIILAIPSASKSTRQQILKSLEPLPINVRSVPALVDFANGKLSTSDIKDIDIDDLLGRDIIEPDEDLLPANIKNKVVMVTGAGGSIGSELCRQIIKLKPSKLILLEQNEFALYQIEQELEEIVKKNGLDLKLNKVLGSINNEVLLKRLFAHKTIQTIYHAAAYKHVPLVEENPVAGLENNVFGTKLLASIALEAYAETFILISTDKAVRPTNVMGCSKRIAELVLQAHSENLNSKTVFSMVRFGNVLGSSGSVVPKFRQQIKDGGPITVTHKEITRFFMSIPEAVQLVIQAGAMAKGGDVFVLDMGEPVKILDLATKMIYLSGLTAKNKNNPNGDIAIEYTGLRPGEKLYEELLIGDNVSGTKHKRIMRANEEYFEIDVLNRNLNNLKKAMQSGNLNTIKMELTQLVKGYKPWLDNNVEETTAEIKVISLNSHPPLF